MAAVNKKTHLSWGTHNDYSNIYPGTRNVKIAKSQKKSVTFSAYMRAVQAAIYIPRHAKVWKFKRSYIAKRRDLSNRRSFVYSISRKFVGKSARDNPERYCGWFWVQCSLKKFEWMAQEAMDVFATAKGSNKSTSQEQGVDHILYYLSGFSRAHFFRHAFNSCNRRCLAAVMPHKSNIRNNW